MVSFQVGGDLVDDGAEAAGDGVGRFAGEELLVAEETADGGGAGEDEGDGGLEVAVRNGVVFGQVGEQAANGDAGGGDLFVEIGDFGLIEEVGEFLDGVVAAVEAVAGFVRSSPLTR